MKNKVHSSIDVQKRFHVFIFKNAL